MHLGVRVLLSLALVAVLTLPASGSAGLPFRLPGHVTPLNAAITLRISPAMAEYEGLVDIDLRLSKPASELRLNAKGLKIQIASVRQGRDQILAESQKLDDDIIALALERQLKPGDYRLTVRFRGTQDERGTAGIFRQHSAGQWYSFTQFQATDARRAFPCFDEPGFKHPWQITLIVPQDATALANTPILLEKPTGDGWKRIEFVPSPPLPSYLVAFALGVFDVHEAGTVGDTPIRILTPPGRSAEAVTAGRYAIESLRLSEEFFARVHPYPKLDIVSVPFLDFGAMEHPGLITFAERALLGNPEMADDAFRRSLATTMAHEIAHQWFGNLVTPAWWDDLWLNESFADWLADKIAAQLLPELEPEYWRLDAREAALAADRHSSTQAIRRPVRNADDIALMFDATIYHKGRSVLDMIEHWLGSDAFRDGVRRFIDTHAGGNARAEDFYTAMAAVGGDVPTVVGSFVTQRGAPLISMKLRCATSGKGKTRIALSQSRYRPFGATPVTTARWSVPLLVHLPEASRHHLMQRANEEILLDDASCPSWIETSPSGPYRLAPLSAARPDALAARTAANLLDAIAAAEAGMLTYEQLESLARPYATAETPQLAMTALKVLKALERRHLHVTGVASGSYAALWRQWFGARVRTVAWQTVRTETPAQRRMRLELLSAHAEHGRDSRLRTQAQRLIEAWLAGTEILPTDLRSALLKTAALEGDRALFEALRKRLDTAATDARLRHDLLSALGNFREPELAERARSLMLDPTLNGAEVARHLLAALAADPAQRFHLLQFIDRHYDSLAKHVPPDSLAILPTHFSARCGINDESRLERAFGRRSTSLPGGTVTFARAMESARICMATRQHFLALHGKPGSATASVP